MGITKVPNEFFLRLEYFGGGNTCAGLTLGSDNYEGNSRYHDLTLSGRSNGWPFNTWRRIRIEIKTTGVNAACPNCQAWRII